MAFENQNLATCLWAEPDMYGTGAERLAYLEGDGYYFTLAFEDHDAYVGETITLRGMYVHGEYSVEVDYLIYVEEKTVLPEQESAFEVHVEIQNQDYNYVTYDMVTGSDPQVYFTLSDLAAAIEVNDIENAILSDNAYVTAYGSDGELIPYASLEDSYTCAGNYSWGWWFDASGQVTNWGDDSHVGVCDETGDYSFVYGSVWIMDDASETEYITYIAYVNATDETVEPVIVKFYVYIDPIELPDTPEASGIIEIQNVVITEGGSYAIDNANLSTINTALGCDIGSATMYMWNPEESDLALAGTYPGNSALPDNNSTESWYYPGCGPTDGWFGEFGPVMWDAGTSNISCLKNTSGDHYTFATYIDGATNTDATCSYQYVNETTETSCLVYIYASHQ